MVNYNNKAYRVARYAIMLAIIFVATLLDRVITLGLPIAGATVELLVTFALCFLFNSWIDGFLASAFMGLSSFILAFPFAKVASQNPLISIVPRLFVTLLTFSLYRLLLLATAKMKNRILGQTIAIVPSTILGLVANTILYMGALTLFTDAYASLVVALQAVAILNVLPERIAPSAMIPSLSFTGEQSHHQFRTFLCFLENGLNLNVARLILLTLPILLRRSVQCI